MVLEITLPETPGSPHQPTFHTLPPPPPAGPASLATLPPLTLDLPVLLNYLDVGLARMIPCVLIFFSYSPSVRLFILVSEKFPWLHPPNLSIDLFFFFLVVRYSISQSSFSSSDGSFFIVPCCVLWAQYLLLPL